MLNLPVSVWLAIGVGAALGAWSRLVLASLFNGAHHSVPLGTLLANVVGGLLIGLAVGWLDRLPALDPVWRLTITTGFLGALTTFSTFSLEAVALLQKGQLGWAAVHSGLHVFGSIAAAAIGLRLTQG